MKKKNPARNTLLFLLITILAVATAGSAKADASTYLPGPSLRISMISQDPDPVQPGEYVELRWMVTNMGSEPLQDVEFKLVPDYPFQLLGRDDGIRNLGTIQGNQKGEEGVILYYRVRIDEDASEGVNKLYLKYRMKGTDWVKLDYYKVRVQSVDAAVIIDSAETTPERITPGREGQLTLNIKNMADSTMKDINVKLDLTLSSVPQPATGTEKTMLYDALPFAPTTSSTEKRISRLKAGQTEAITYDLTAYPDATSRVYKIPVIITYRDELDKEYTKNDLVGLIVGAEPDIYATIDQSDLIAGKKTGTVSFKIVNKGVSDIKFLDVKLKKSPDYEITSSDEEYIGNIDSDDFESVDFTVYLKDNDNAKKEGTITFPLEITFKDANNKDHTKEVNLNYKLYTPEAKGQAKSNSALILIITVIIIIAGWLIYRKVAKKKKQKE